jgi:hypothetical protein
MRNPPPGISWPERITGSCHSASGVAPMICTRCAPPWVLGIVRPTSVFALRSDPSTTAMRPPVATALTAAAMASDGRPTSMSHTVPDVAAPANSDGTASGSVCGGRVVVVVVVSSGAELVVAGVVVVVVVAGTSPRPSAKPPTAATAVAMPGRSGRVMALEAPT